jgi:very-short-patch-repair endonuclease
VARETLDSRGKSAPPHADALAAGIAARQFGVVTMAQLRVAGLSDRAIEYRIAMKRLQRLWRGVFAFGHQELTIQGHLIAAVFACGPGAVLSQRSATEHWELLARLGSWVHVTVPGHTGRRKRRGIHVHCVRSLHPDDVTKHNGIPITTPARTLVDLSAAVPDRLLERAYEQAEIRRLLPPGALEGALARSNGRKTRALRRLIAIERRIATVTRSELEELFLELVRRDGLPEPEVNRRVAGYEVDFLWDAQRLVIEVDGFAYHSTRQAQTRDRRKDDDLQAAGYRVVRFTADQILRDPADTLARTRRAALARQ